MKESFSGIADTRQQAQVRRDLYEIIAMTIAAVIGNSDGWDEIEDFCRNKEVWLREHMKLELEHGIQDDLFPVVTADEIEVLRILPGQHDIVLHVAEAAIVRKPGIKPVRIVVLYGDVQAGFPIAVGDKGIQVVPYALENGISMYARTECRASMASWRVTRHHPSLF